VIDLHAHILPGVDDGAADLETSVAMCMTAVAEGIGTMAATPHVNRDHPPDPKAMSYAVGTLNVALARMEVALAVLPGGEVEMATASELDDDTLQAFCLGGGHCLLLESPYGGDFDLPWLDELIASLQERGFRPLLAHPERSPLFQADAGHLEALVERGVHCTVNAGSMTGRSGDAARDCAVELFRRGLVHAVSTDATTTRAGRRGCGRRSTRSSRSSRACRGCGTGAPRPPRPRSWPASRCRSGRSCAPSGRDAFAGSSAEARI
jgi:protein-tyrosine phosphatase